MALTPFIRWTDISVKDTSLQGLIQLLNRRLGRGAPNDLALCHLIIGDGATVIAAGVYGDVAFDKFPGEILSWTMVGTLPLATNGSIVLDIWNKPFGSAAEPVAANSIMTAGTKPTITAARQARSAAVTAWRTKVNKDDILRVNVDSAALFTQVTFSMTMSKG